MRVSAGRGASAVLILVGAMIVGRATPAECARVLAIVTMGGKSHWNFMSSVLGALTDNGHRVTVFTPFLDGNRENYTEIDTSDAVPVHLAMDLTEVRPIFADLMTMHYFFMKADRRVCEKLHGDRRLKDVVARGLRDHFDAVIIEPRRYDCFSYLAGEASLPLIFLYPMSSVLMKEREWTGHVSNPATTSLAVSDHAVPRTFSQRFSNAATLLYATVIFRSMEFWFRNVDSKPYDSHASVPPSLMFVNSDLATDMSRPTPPNVINIGGIHLKPAGKIPKDILEFIEDSPRGVVIFTLGSVSSLDSLPENVKRALISGLAEIPLKVLLKYDGAMPDKPKNVMTGKWFSQRDILMHPNVKLFISHGGMSGTVEAVDAGVPVLGFPLFFDQYRNIDRLVEAGMAISMEILTVTKGAFVKNVLELVNDEKYTKNAKNNSNIFRDRPLSPKQSVVYWTEYVIRHKGAPHLKPYGIHLPWYQYFLLDVICVMFFSVFIVLFVLYKIIKLFIVLIKKFVRTVTKTKSE